VSAISRIGKILRLAAALWIAGAASAALYGQASVLTWHNDNLRTGQNLQETALTPANVNASTFGRLFTISVDQRVDAEPLYLPALVIPGQGIHNVLFVVTEHDSVYAFDADTGTQLWHVSLLLMGELPSDNRGCGQVTPEIGITSTPVIDPQMGPHGTMYVVAMSKNGTTYHQRVHALDLTTGGEEFGGPVDVQATYPGNGSGSVGGVLTFDPKQYKERAGLLLWNGTLYTSWASHCDASPYTGWVIGYNESNLSRVSVLNLTPNGNDGAVWAAGAGPAADAKGNVYLLVANGTFDTTLNGGFPNMGDYGNAFVKIGTGGTSVVDYFTMSNTTMESNGDEDLGSGGAMLLPTLNDAQGHPHDLAVGAGKDGNVYVVDQANMGKYNSVTNSIYQELPFAVGANSGSAVFSSPAWFNGNLYYGGNGDTLKAFTFSNGLFGTTPASHSSITFPFPGATPSISANGSANGIVWAAENSGTAVLHAYDAGNLSTELYNSNQAANRDHFGAGNKFIVPMVVNGKVYVGTTNGVGAFGLFCGSASVQIPANNAFGVSLNPTLTWTAATGGTSYDVAFSATSPPSLVATGLTGTSYAVTTSLTAGRRYFWYVITHNCAGSVQSPTWSFTTAGGQPDKGAVFRNGLWVIDLNGNFQWDGPGIDRGMALGQSGDIPVTGDWNGDGRQKAGIFRNGMWVLDYNGNGQWDGPSIDKVAFLGQAGDIPVVGDWNGSGTSKIGVFRNGLWVLDYNGNFQWDGTAVDRAMALGQAGDTPVVGDWNGSGTSKGGVFRNGLWVLDYNGNFQWDGTLVDRAMVLGQAGDIPVVGDWNGSGTAKGGVFRNGLWVLDYNGNFQWDGTSVDVAAFLGQGGDVPVVGDWNGSGSGKIGIFRNGLWVFDYNGNFQWDGTTIDRAMILGQAGDVPMPAKW
jgi:hypothetical protein